MTTTRCPRCPGSYAREPRRGRRSPLRTPSRRRLFLRPASKRQGHRRRQRGWRWGQPAPVPEAAGDRRPKRWDGSRPRHATVPRACPSLPPGRRRRRARWRRGAAGQRQCLQPVAVVGLLRPVHPGLGPAGTGCLEPGESLAAQRGRRDHPCPGRARRRLPEPRPLAIAGRTRPVAAGRRGGRQAPPTLPQRTT